MKQLLFIAVTLFLSACLKLDNNLYNKAKLSDYQLDNYTGEQDFLLDASYSIDANLINVFSLSSQAGGEKKATTIKALYIGNQAKINTDTVILYCHGNKWHMDFYWQRAKLLAHVNGKNRYGVLMMDYRGYGASDGSPTEEGMFADVDACMTWLKDRGLNSERLIIYGFSLGSAPATRLSSETRSLRPSKLILEAPFASSEVMVQDASRLNMPADYFTDLKIDNAEKIKQVNQAFLWLHGTNDNFLNYKTHGEVVYKNYRGTYQENYLIQNADHSEVPAKMGFEKYLAVIGNFIRK